MTFGTSPVIQLRILQEIPMSGKRGANSSGSGPEGKPEAGHRRVTQGFSTCLVSAAQRNHGEAEMLAPFRILL